jgi:ring-1,2-phenylacetyl-CoA epoxidase subunit PaaD
MVVAAQAETRTGDELARRQHRREESDCPQLWALLDQVRDPEIPVISIWDLGILKDVRRDGDRVTVVITPTYSGCPAMREIENDIRRVLEEANHDQVEIRTELSPAWSTEHMTEAGKQALQDYGIAPPKALDDPDREVPCPRCGSRETHRVSQFGSTACKALYQCDECREPFDHFKCI